MTIDDLRAQGLIIFECISGSRAYGTSHPASDTDLRGVFVLPEADFFGLNYVEQVNNPTNDVTFYELRRFVELVAKNNPNVLELLNMPPDCIVYQHPLFAQLRPELFLSRLCRFTFASYAYSQVQKARGLNKKVLNPVDRERKGILDFCYVAEGQGAVPVQQWLAARNLAQEHCGLASVPHGRDLYALFHDAGAQGAHPLGFRGLVHPGTSADVLLSSVPKGLAPLAYLSFNKDGYSKYCHDYKEYWDWVANRNEARYASTIAHGKNYDAKNLMHTFRLLDMAEEIATEGRLVVRRPNRDHLLRVRAGEFEYDYLLAQAEAKMQQVEAAFAASSLPEKPDLAAIGAQLVAMRRAFYAAWPPQLPSGQRDEI
jgi:uncharacterized protein